MSGISTDRPLIIDETHQEKTARIEIRVDRERKSLLEKAASLLGESLSSFVLSRSLSDAVRIINEHNTTRLSLADWDRFNEIVSHPQAPNEDLVKAVEEYNATISHSDGI